MIGVIIDLVELLVALKRGARSAEALDFYGEYKLVLRRVGDCLECENELAKDKFRVPSELFRAAARRWSDYMLAGIEVRHSSIVRNHNYQRHKAYIFDAWREQAARESAAG